MRGGCRTQPSLVRYDPNQPLGLPLMRRTNTHYRTFTEAYREHTSLHRHGWPGDALMRLWFAKVCGLKGSIYTDLKAGDPVPDKYAYWFVRLLVGGDDRIEQLNTTPGERERLEEARAVTTAFLTPLGISTLTPALADAILEHVCYPRVPATHGIGVFIDYLRYKVASLSDIIFKGEYPDWVHGCDKDDLPEIVRWMYTRVGHGITPDGRLLAPSQARIAAARYMRLEEAEYCRRAILWSHDHPWSVVRAWHRTVGEIGMSIALPITEIAYREIAEGRLTPYDCTPAHLSPTSLNIVLEAMAENPPYVGRSDPNPTESLRVCSVYQIAALARTNLLSDKAQVRIISFAGTPENEARLRSSGFLPNGATMRHPDPETRLKIYELKIKVNQLVSKHFLEAAVLSHAGKHLPVTPPKDAPTGPSSEK